MKPAVSVALFLWLAPAVGAQITVPKEVSGEVGQFVRVVANCKGEVQWASPDAGLAVFPGELLKDSRTAVVVGMKPGRYRLWAWTCEAGKPTPHVQTVVIIGGAPAPEPPNPPKPDPPTPTPPGPAKALRVLLLYETADVNKYTAGQRGVLFGQAMRDYLNLKCTAEPDGWKAFRIWDQNVTSAADPRNWKPLVDRPHPQMPWIVIADGDRVLHEGPMPPDATQTMALIGKWGG